VRNVVQNFGIMPSARAQKRDDARRRIKPRLDPDAVTDNAWMSRGSVAPQPLLDAVSIIDELFDAKDWRSMLENRAAELDLATLASSTSDDSGDENGQFQES
jgi:hypothetical protein